MSKTIPIILLLLTASCNTKKMVKEETQYFSFERPTYVAFDTVIYFQESSNVSKAQKAVGQNRVIEPNIRGRLVIDDMDIDFSIEHPQLKNSASCPCSDYSSEYLKQHGETITQNDHDYRIVKGKSNKKWIELCIDEKHQFFIKDVEQDKAEMINVILKSIKINQ